jgi:hypothetical protein
MLLRSSYSSSASFLPLPLRFAIGSFIVFTFLIDIRTICLVELVFYVDYKFIVEQLFTSLLQTYRSFITDNPKTADTNDIAGNLHQKNYYDLEKITTETAEQSQWAGVVRRKSFWDGLYASCTGLNYQSPI